LPKICMTIFKFVSFFILISTFNDAPFYNQYGIQTTGAPILTAMLAFHHYLVAILIVIGGCVFYLLWYILYTFNTDVFSRADALKFSHSNELEIGWTVIPAIVLLFLAIPSFSLLYSLDESINPSLTIKVIGHQWYWSYEYSDFGNYSSEDEENNNTFQFDSYMIPNDSLKEGMFRLLEVDNRLHIPLRTHIRVLVTSSDVLHSWAVPSLGIKIDACPGRLSQISLYAQRKSVFYGQCSEICGINHGFMPIVVVAQSKSSFFRWLLWNTTNSI
jgi:cytochrome c oxidase subunit 2